MITLIDLTDNSWVFKTKDLYGILFRNNDSYNLKTVNSSLDFNSLDELQKKYGKIIYKERENNNSSDNINGYPVKDKNYTVVDHDNIIYVKKNTYNISKIEFKAGYWSIKYPNGWNINLCPKLSTLEQYENQGPFRTKMECVNNNNILNTRDNFNG